MACLQLNPNAVCHEPKLNHRSPKIKAQTCATRPMREGLNPQGLIILRFFMAHFWHFSISFRVGLVRIEIHHLNLRLRQVLSPNGFALPLLLVTDRASSVISVVSALRSAVSRTIVMRTLETLRTGTVLAVVPNVPSGKRKQRRVFGRSSFACINYGGRSVQLQRPTLLRASHPLRAKIPS